MNQNGETVEFGAAACVLTTGTFLNGKIKLGDSSFDGGRSYRNSIDWEPPTNKVSRLFEEKGIERIRLRTGTPPRLDKNTVDYSVLELQPSEEFLDPFHLLHRKNLREGRPINNEQHIDCYLAQTNSETKKIVMDNIHLLPDYKEAKPPRYCPSIDAKYMRFKDRESHNIWLEPESNSNNVLFPNGLSTGFPLSIQARIVNSMKGLERAKILRPAYAVEYDCVNPQQLHNTLELKKVPGLFLAGQLNGTTGKQD